MSLVILDIGIGNTASMVWALERLGAKPRLSSEPAAIRDASRLVMPGVGAAAHAMAQLELLGLVDVLSAFERPVLGICLGMQLLLEGSDEGLVDCLGLIPGRARLMDSAPDRPVPHMGWNQLEAIDVQDPLADGLEDGGYVYFVHSYAASVSPATTAQARYGEAFSAMVRKGNVWGCQFHPERSGRVGARILENFLRLPC